MSHRTVGSSGALLSVGEEKLPMDFRFCNFADILLAFGGKYINSTIEFILLQYFNVIWAS